jgi:RNA polymerase sigma-70 factor (ECF subfamily)
VEPDLAKQSDAMLLAKSAKNPDAFAAFYRRHSRGVLAYLVRACGDRELALDLTSEVFAAALIASHRYRADRGPAPAWLFGIARNKVARARRDHARADSARKRLGVPALNFTDAALERVEDILDAQRSGVSGGLADLSAQEREAVVARVVDERGYDDLALATGSSQAAIRQRVSRGLAKLSQRAKGRT